jgi:hypothetical protein
MEHRGIMIMEKSPYLEEKVAPVAPQIPHELDSDQMQTSKMAY